jgi:hypothetical protein
MGTETEPSSLEFSLKFFERCEIFRMKVDVGIFLPRDNWGELYSSCIGEISEIGKSQCLLNWVGQVKRG